MQLLGSQNDMATIRLGDAGQLALQEVVLFMLGDVEFGAEGVARGEEARLGGEGGLRVLVEVVEHAEE